MTFNQVGTAASPIDPVLGPLAANGGLTPTHALRAGSPAIGTGDPVDCDASPNARRDQRGKARNASARMACDIGAYDTTGTPVQTLDVRATARTEPTCATASYTKPFKTLGAALACARNGALIRLGAGRYTEAVSVPANVTLAGAGAATVIAHPDDGSQQPTVAIAPGRWVTLKTLVVDGKGGFAPAVTAGEGVLALYGARVTGGQDFSGRGGGGISVDAPGGSTAVRIFNSTVDHNFSDVAGGGMWLSGGARGLAATIDNSTISGNTADGVRQRHRRRRHRAAARNGGAAPQHDHRQPRPARRRPARHAGARRRDARQHDPRGEHGPRRRPGLLAPQPAARRSRSATT